jgi:hypothetical protein
MKKLLFLLLVLPLASCAVKGGSNPTATTSGSSSGSTTGSTSPSVQLSWNASTGSPSGYYVQKSTDGTNYNTIQTVTGTTATVANLTHGQTYYFRIQAYNAGGFSGASNVFTVTP